MNDHIVINVATGQYECQHCKATQSPPKMPVAIDKLLAHMDMFSAAHRNCSKAPAQPALDPVHEYRKGFIAGQIDMRDRPEEQPAQGPVGQTICNTCNGTGVVRNLHDWTTGKKREQKCWNCHAPAAQPAQKPLTDDLLGLLKEARKIIRASSSRNLVKDWDGRATQAIEQALKEKNNG
jgi:hypothetical protein